LVATAAAKRESVFTSLAPASERQDHTTSPSASCIIRPRKTLRLTLPRPSYPAPNVRDDREPPLLRERDTARKPLIWGRRKAAYFCKRDWTTQIALNHLTKSRFTRGPFAVADVVRRAVRDIDLICPSDRDLHAKSGFDCGKLSILEEGRSAVKDPPRN
jgi:hypothetical protein